MKRPEPLLGAVLLALAVAGCGSPSSPSDPPAPSSPKIVCPAPFTIQSPDGKPTQVVYGSATASGGTPPISITCAPDTASIFPVGVTPVTCTAKDQQQRTDSCSFTVTVTKPPVISRTRFLAFGDSITWGEDGSDVQSKFHVLVQLSGPYPTLLLKQLTARYTSQTIVVANAGSPGEKAGNPDTLVRFHGALGLGYDSVLLLEGANDLADAVKDSKAYSAALANLRQMVRDARDRGLRVFLATLPPENPKGFRGTGAALVNDFNAQIRLMVQSEGISPVVDVAQAFGGDLSLLSSDGLHPNQAGYQLMADTFYKVLKDTLEATSAGASAPPPPFASAFGSPLR